jgi:SAM-dependent methyltransferase
VSANEAERARWNDDYWTTVWPKRERLTTMVTPFLLEALGPRDAEAVLEVGPGGGLATLEIAARVGTGHVTGADVSVALTDLARRRARERGVANVTFHVIDAQEEDVPGGPFDAVASQFGVMFFDHPERAFARLHAQVTPRGRMAFACWRAVELNPWFSGPALAGFVAPPAPSPPGASPTGPFALADAAVTTQMLEGAGWGDVAVAPVDLVAAVEANTLVDDGMLRFLGVADADLAGARASVDAHLARLARGDGLFDAPLAFQIVTARA